MAFKCVVKTDAKFPEGVFALTAISGGTFFCRGSVLEGIWHATQLVDPTTDESTLFFKGELAEGWRLWGKQWIFDLTVVTKMKEDIAAKLGRNVSQSFVIVFPWSSSMVTRRLVFWFTSQIEPCSLADGEFTAKSNDVAVVCGSGLETEEP